LHTKQKDGTAIAGSDYNSNSGTLSFAAGETIKTISVTVNGDTNVESDETFKVVLSNAINATITKTTATGTILNDDAAFAQQANNLVSNNTQTAIKIFPNPVTNNYMQVSINPVYTTSLKLLLYDANGNIAKLQLIGSNTSNIKIDLSTLNSGNYFLVLTDGKQILYKEKIEVLH
jgi:hypothetical protein